MTYENLYDLSLNKAMALCSRREYCRNDIMLKLQLWGIEIKEADKIIDVLVKENYLNEMRYASAFARDKFKYNKWGKIKIAAQLGEKHIPCETINSALATIDNEAYTDTLVKLISAYRKSVKAKNSYDLKGKLLRFGLSKGFESYLLYDIINKMEE